MRVDHATIDLDLVITRMQDAVDIVLSSEHEKNKIAACLFSPDGNPLHSIRRNNHRPHPLKELYPWDARIGISSQFVHAETACILEYDGSVKGMWICITDPFCPNCAKNIAESGITKIFIDHKGMDKDFVQRRAGAFNLQSLTIAAAAGIDVYILYRKERRIELLRAAESVPDTQMMVEGVFLNPYDRDSAFEEMDYKDGFCAGHVTDRTGNQYTLVTQESLPPGLNATQRDTLQPVDTDKYRFEMDAFNKFLLALRRENLTLFESEKYFFSDHIPSSRNIVNLLITDIRKIKIGVKSGHDITGLDVLEKMQQQEILTICSDERMRDQRPDV